MRDYHIHYKICHHGTGELHEYVERAIELGLTEIGFSEHIPIPGLDDPTGRMSPHEFDTYLQDVSDAQRNYSEIKILLGIEADYLPAYMQYIEHFLTQYPFDYVLGSVHFIDDWDFSNPEFVHRLHEKGAEQLWMDNFRILAQAAQTGLYDIIAHADLPKRIVESASERIDAELENTLDIFQQTQIALDVNTSGLRRFPWEVYPHPGILRRAFALNIPIVLGSDAHHPNDVAAGFTTVLGMLKNIGYTHSLKFEKRRSEAVAL